MRQWGAWGHLCSPSWRRLPVAKCRENQPYRQGNNKSLPPGSRDDPRAIMLCVDYPPRSAVEWRSLCSNGYSDWLRSAARGRATGLSSDAGVWCMLPRHSSRGAVEPRTPELITRGERRRRWSVEQKREIAAESHRHGSGWQARAGVLSRPHVRRPSAPGRQCRRASYAIHKSPEAVWGTGSKNWLAACRS